LAWSPATGLVAVLAEQRACPASLDGEAVQHQPERRRYAPKYSPAPPGSRYQDQRHYVTPRDLDELRGPAEGLVVLDHRLDWSGNPGYNLAEPGDVLVMYQTVLNEATTPGDLGRWLDGDTLRRLWTSMWLPPRLRALWEARFPELANLSRLMTT
jgi:hypothetical protein